jgi:hypothetical protein
MCENCAIVKDRKTIRSTCVLGSRVDCKVVKLNRYDI